MPERTATAYGEAHQRESLYIRLQTPGTWDPNNYMSITERGSVSGGQISSNFEKRFLPMDLPAHRVSMIVEDDLNIWNARKRKFVTRVLSLRKYIIDPNRRT
ncbi:MAG: hypothetical protein JWO96_824 [Candidatus Saccharibacteria bacterium]|nr:hypothetical protein [Candidatus Saccharibacteria bacterium]